MRESSVLKKLRDIDPAVGIGLVILGIFVMGVSGAATWHYPFNIGTGIAILGAVLFVMSVTLSTLREKKA
ncbi:MAG: hypothetical protein HOV80_30675 [Polyangiaceae bacterium]|nr:hypothetical protein [Polyangiaceae bacterium]